MMINELNKLEKVILQRLFQAKSIPTVVWNCVFFVLLVLEEASEEQGFQWGHLEMSRCNHNVSQQV